MTAQTIRVIARIVAQPSKVEDTRILLAGIVEATRKENGCVHYELMQNRANPAEFTTLEEWANEAAIAAHMASDHVQAAFAKAGALLAEAPDIRQYTRLA